MSNLSGCFGAGFLLMDDGVGKHENVLFPISKNCVKCFGFHVHIPVNIWAKTDIFPYDIEFANTNSVDTHRQRMIVF